MKKTLFQDPAPRRQGEGFGRGSGVVAATQDAAQHGGANVTKNDKGWGSSGTNT